MIGEYFDADPRHGGTPVPLTPAFTQQHVVEGGSFDNSAKSSGACSQTSSDCSWRPDMSFSTARAKAWQQSDQQLAGQALQTDGNGMYTVQFGDSLSGIAKRYLQGQGNDTPSKDDIGNEVSQIVQDNHDRYQSLDCNTDLVKVGWKLVVGGNGGNDTASAPPPEQSAPPAPERPAPAQDTGNYPDGGPQVNEYHINNAYFGDRQQQGWAPNQPVDGYQPSNADQERYPTQVPYSSYMNENPMWPPQNYYARPPVSLEFGVMQHRPHWGMPVRPVPYGWGGGGWGPSIGAGIRIGGGRGGVGLGINLPLF
ncbi:MAG TPA: LysM peptidoglycan-binding domain-containing protein [Planktothrix sp.]|jgi:hypothetical protein